MIMEQIPGRNGELQQEQEVIVISSPENEKDEIFDEFIDNDKQIVLYNPPVNQFPNDTAIERFLPMPEPVSEPMPERTPVQYRPRVLPEVSSFTVQCALCFKWRFIPSKEKYEEIREHIKQIPFICEYAKEWRPEISCDVPADLEQDASRLWAIDRPNIAKPPPGWDRELRIRGEGGSKFADVYYTSPTGKRLRSMVEVNKYLEEHPEYVAQGVSLSQFSFQIPKPLQADYVRKRPARIRTPFDEPVQVNPLSWAAPCDATTLQLPGPYISPSYTMEAPTYDAVCPPAKKARFSMMHTSSSDPSHSHVKYQRFKINGPRPPPNEF